MKVIKFPLIIFLIISQLSCSETEYTHNEIRVLKSPSGKSIFYSVFDESTMAFGSGRTRYIILDSSESINKISENDFLKFPSNNIIKVLGWQDDYNLQVLNITTDKQPQNLNPTKIDTLTFKKWNFIITHYYANAFGKGEIEIDNIKIFNDSIIFTGKNDFKRTALNGQVSIPQGNIHREIEIFCLEKDMKFIRMNEKGKTITGQPQIGLVHYNPILSPTEYAKLDTDKVFRVIKKVKQE